MVKEGFVDKHLPNIYVDTHKCVLLELLAKGMSLQLAEVNSKTLS